MTGAATIKTERDLKSMRVACDIVECTLNEIKTAIKAGITTAELDKLAKSYICGRGAVPGFLNYQGYPASICISINSEVVHGIPSKRVIKEGDLVSVDVGAVYEGWNGDAARTFLVGLVTDEAKRLAEVTRECFFKGAEQARAGNHMSDISLAIQEHAQSHGYGVVRELVGHGIGRFLHEAPEVPNFWSKKMGRGVRLEKGMTLAIEPMINEGGEEITVNGNNWTVETMDGKLSAHYENTILITDAEPEILTLKRWQSD